MRNVSKIFFVIHIIHFLQRRFDRMKHQFIFEYHRLEIHKRRSNNNRWRHDEKQSDHFTNRSQKCAEWFRIYELFFAMIKYKLIHFRRLLFSSDLKIALKFSDHDLISSSKCKYLKMIMNSQFTWKYHLKHFEKKPFNKFNILIALINSIWKINIENLKRIYFVTILP